VHGYDGSRAVNCCADSATFILKTLLRAKFIFQDSTITKVLFLTFNFKWIVD